MPTDSLILRHVPTGLAQEPNRGYVDRLAKAGPHKPTAASQITVRERKLCQDFFCHLFEGSTLPTIQRPSHFEQADGRSNEKIHNVNRSDPGCVSALGDGRE